MATIYITKKVSDRECETFIGKDGKSYDKLWAIERKLEGNMQLCGANINGKLRCIDFSLPTQVEKLPRGSKPVEDYLAEFMWQCDDKSGSYQFGNIF
ncbi:MAG: hypothetical protein K0R54_561 [Clostridiaceae bacterium]|jgi:hypothetical protein|nr:hypothetical protein [Clostridiaceae bacterium]